MKKKGMRLKTSNAMILLVFFCWVLTVAYGSLFGFTSQLLNMVKPITLFQYLSLLLFMLIFNKYYDKIKKYRVDILIISFLLLMVSYYEMMWNFLFWFSQYNFYGIGTDIDNITYDDIRHKFFPINITVNEEVITNKPVNLNVNSKLSVLVFFIALYTILKVVTSGHD